MIKYSVCNVGLQQGGSMNSALEELLAVQGSSPSQHTKGGLLKLVRRALEGITAEEQEERVVVQEVERLLKGDLSLEEIWNELCDLLARITPMIPVEDVIEFLLPKETTSEEEEANRRLQERFREHLEKTQKGGKE